MQSNRLKETIEMFLYIVQSVKLPYRQYTEIDQVELSWTLKLVSVRRFEDR